MRTSNKFSYLLFGLLLLVCSACTSTTTTQQTERAVPIIDMISCKRDTSEYFQDVDPLIQEFLDTLQVAISSPRLVMGNYIQDLQLVRRNIENIPVPKCAEGPTNLMIVGMNNIIDGLILFMGEENEVTVENKFKRGSNNISNALDQLSALASGQPTPEPILLPTYTPIPTRVPTPTPFPVGSSTYVKSNMMGRFYWEISVNNIEILHQIERYGYIYKPQGRFVVLYLTVTNKANSPIKFSTNGSGNLIIRDANRISYREDLSASLHASEINNMDNSVKINPDDSNNIVLVFDISEDSEFYTLETFGSEVYLFPVSVYLDIPKSTINSAQTNLAPAPTPTIFSPILFTAETVLTVRMDEWRFDIDRLETEPGDDPLEQKLILLGEATNQGQRVGSFIPSSKIRLRDTNGSIYQTDDLASIDIIINGMYGTELNPEINPSESVYTAVVFTIPIDEKTFTIVSGILTDEWGGDVSFTIP